MVFWFHQFLEIASTLIILPLHTLKSIFLAPDSLLFSKPPNVFELWKNSHQPGTFGFFPLKCFTWKIFLKDSISFNLPTWMIVWLFVYEFEFPKLGASIFNGFWNFMVIYLLIMCRNFQLSNKKTRLYLLWRQEFSQILCCFHTNIQVDHLLF